MGKHTETLDLSAAQHGEAHTAEETQRNLLLNAAESLTRDLGDPEMGYLDTFVASGMLVESNKGPAARNLSTAPGEWHSTSKGLARMEYSLPSDSSQPSLRVTFVKGDGRPDQGSDRAWIAIEPFFFNGREGVEVHGSDNTDGNITLFNVFPDTASGEDVETGTSTMTDAAIVVSELFDQAQAVVAERATAEPAIERSVEVGETVRNFKVGDGVIIGRKMPGVFQRATVEEVGEHVTVGTAQWSKKATPDYLRRMLASDAQGLVPIVSPEEMLAPKAGVNLQAWERRVTAQLAEIHPPHDSPRTLTLQETRGLVPFETDQQVSILRNSGVFEGGWTINNVYQGSSGKVAVEVKSPAGTRVVSIADLVLWQNQAQQTADLTP